MRTLGRIVCMTPSLFLARGVWRGSSGSSQDLEHRPPRQAREETGHAVEIRSMSAHLRVMCSGGRATDILERRVAANTIRQKRGRLGRVRHPPILCNHLVSGVANPSHREWEDELAIGWCPEFVP